MAETWLQVDFEVNFPDYLYGPRAWINKEFQKVDFLLSLWEVNFIFEVNAV